MDAHMRPSNFRPLFFSLIAVAMAFIAIFAINANVSIASEPAHKEAPKAPVVISGQVTGKKSEPTADHSKFKALQGPFKDGSEVTKACLTCHNKAGHQIMQTLHWKWEGVNPATGQTIGKNRLINNFCTNARGNEGMCASCHISYGHKETKFDYNNQNNIDCVVCHDRTGTYYKTTPTQGNKSCSVMFEGQQPIDLTKVSQHVGMPGRENCGACHFNGGGGDNVKHGDLSSALINANKKLDVHMDSQGLNFSCTACHITTNHLPTGSRYLMDASGEHAIGKPGMRSDSASCQSCHTDKPHLKNNQIDMKLALLNSHTDKVACQTCHIPKFARGGVATITHWDWRTAGKTDKTGNGYSEHNYIQGNGEERATYKSIKGSFVNGENVTPVYRWFNGVMKYTMIDTKFDPKKPVDINHFEGSYNDPKARIWPFKRMDTWQPYDAGNNTLVYNYLWGDDKDAYWGNYNMERSVKVGMEKNGVPYSGKLGYIETFSWWPITHMVAPKEDALKCTDCHSPNGLLKDLNGFYMPGRDHFKWLDILGFLGIGFTIIGVSIHGMLRMTIEKNKKQGA